MRQVAALAALLLTSAAFAQPTAPSREPPGDVREFTVTARAPVLGARPFATIDAASRVPGNAADLWREAFKSIWTDVQSDAFDAIKTTDPEALQALARERPDLITPLPDAAWDAARASSCDWGVDPRRGFDLPLAHLTLARRYSVMLAAKARLAAAVGDYAAVSRTTTVLDRLAHDVEQPRLFVTHAIAIGVRRQWLETVRASHTLGNSPNLYFELPGAMTTPPERAEIFANERALVLFSVPDLQRFRSGQELTPAEWKAVLERVSEIARDKGRGPHPMETDPAKGPELFREYEQLSDLLFRWAGSEYPVARPRTIAASRELSRQLSRGPAERNPFLILLSDSSRLLWVTEWIDREIAAFTAVEALRAHAANNAGSFPASLSDLTDFPAPDNPITGRTFDYVLNPDTSATLSDDTNPGYALRYTIRLRN